MGRSGAARRSRRCASRATGSSGASWGPRPAPARWAASMPNARSRRPLHLRPVDAPRRRGRGLGEQGPGQGAGRRAHRTHDRSSRRRAKRSRPGAVIRETKGSRATGAEGTPHERSRRTQSTRVGMVHREEGPDGGAAHAARRTAMLDARPRARVRPCVAGAGVRKCNTPPVAMCGGAKPCVAGRHAHIVVHGAELPAEPPAGAVAA